MQSRLRVFRRFLIAGLLVLVCGCTTIYNPATGRNENLLIDTRSEVVLGSDISQQISLKQKILNDPRRLARLQGVGLRVAAVSDRGDLEYHFQIIQSKEFNAFAVPGGYVYVNQGLFDAVTDDELACVVGHEVGHLAARHSVKRIQAAMGYNLVMGIVAAATGQDAIVSATNIVAGAVTNGFSRGDELLADRLAVRYARRSGFDPQGMISFFGKMQNEQAKNGSQLRIVFLSSHPPTDQRIKAVQDEIARNP